MTPFDLLFLIAALTTLGTLIIIAVAALRGRRVRALQLLTRLGAGAGLYFAVLVAVSLLSPARELPIGREQCSDDWCITVSGADRTSAPDADVVEAAFRLASRAARASQRERFVVAYLVDADGRRYDSTPAAGDIPFDVLLAPLETKEVHRTFRVPPGAKRLGVTIAREGAGRFPGCCIIGDEGSLLHRRSVVRLP